MSGGADQAFQWMPPGVTWTSDPDLRQMQFPELEWWIPGELPVGYTIVLGAPKVGKTALVLPVAHQLVREHGARVLYLKLDDSLRRMRSRTIAANPAKDDLQGLWYVDGWAPRNAYEAFGQLNWWLAEARARGWPFDAVVVDTYGMFVGRRPPGDVFGFDYEMGKLFKRLCEEHGISIIVTHHTRKGAGAEEDWLDVVSGSAGITAACDSIWYITRTRGGRDGVLRIAGNDVEEVEKPMILGADMVWRPDNTISPAQSCHTGVPRMVLDLLQREAELTTGQIAEQVGTSQNNVHVTSQRLRNEGLIDHARGSDGKFYWSLTDVPANRVGCWSGLDEPPRADDRVEDPPKPGPSTAAPAAPPAEAVPLYAGSSRATSKLLECLSANPDGTKRRLYPLFRLSDELKAEMPYDRMCLGGKSNQWALWPTRAPARGELAFRFDRKASYWSSSPWLVPNVLTRTGPLTMAEVREGRLAGVFQIAPTPWVHKNLPSPYGQERPRARELVTRSTLNRLHALSSPNPKTGAGPFMDMPPILMGWTGRGTERLLNEWLDWCLKQRREAAGDPELSAAVKRDQNLAIGELRVVTDGKVPGPVDRWDWQYAMVSQHYAMMQLYGMRSLLAGEPLAAVGNTDELVYVVPAGTPPDWVPASLQPLIERHAFALRGVEDAAAWFERHGRGSDDA